MLPKGFSIKKIAQVIRILWKVYLFAHLGAKTEVNYNIIITSFQPLRLGTECLSSVNLFFFWTVIKV